MANRDTLSWLGSTSNEECKIGLVFTVCDEEQRALRKGEWVFARFATLSSRTSQIGGVTALPLSVLQDGFG